MQSTASILQLREELKRLSGPARIGTLSRLAQALEEQFWRTGPGLPQALPDLNEAIDHFGEVLTYLQPGDAMRGLVSVKLGILVGNRLVAYGGDEGGRESGIRLLVDALAFPNIPAILVALGNLTLAQLYLSRTSAGLSTIGTARPLISADGAAPLSTEDLDHAEACLRTVLDGQPMTSEIAATAELLLEMAGALRDILGSLRDGPAAMDFSRMILVMNKIQDIQSQLRARPHNNIATLVALDPLDRPVTVVSGPQHLPHDHQDGRPQRKQDPPAGVDREQLRQELQAQLLSAAKRTGTAPAQAWASAAALLLPTAAPPPVQLCDDIVALASMIVDGQPDEDPQTAGTDWFVLAAALKIRDRVDIGGDGTDRVSGSECLLTAVKTIPGDHPAAMTAFRCLGAFLDGTRPRGGLPDRVAEGIADRIDSMIATKRAAQPADRATLHALRCLCRADDVAAMQRAVAATPRDYPWLELIKAVERTMRQADPAA